MALSVVTVQCSVKLHLNSHHIFLQKQQLFFHSVGPFIAETQFGQKEADILEWNFCINIVSAPWKSLNPDFLSLFAHLSHLHAHALNPGSKDFCFMKRNVWPVGIKSPTDCVIIRFSLKANFRVFFFFFFFATDVDFLARFGDWSDSRSLRLFFLHALVCYKEQATCPSSHWKLFGLPHSSPPISSPVVHFTLFHFFPFKYFTLCQWSCFALTRPHRMRCLASGLFFSRSEKLRKKLNKRVLGLSCVTATSCLRRFSPTCCAWIVIPVTPRPSVFLTHMSQPIADTIGRVSGTIQQPLHLAGNQWEACHCTTPSASPRFRKLKDSSRPAHNDAFVPSIGETGGRPHQRMLHVTDPSVSVETGTFSSGIRGPCSVSGKSGIQTLCWGQSGEPVCSSTHKC